MNSQLKENLWHVRAIGAEGLALHLANILDAVRHSINPYDASSMMLVDDALNHPYLAKLREKKNA